MAMSTTARSTEKTFRLALGHPQVRCSASAREMDSTAQVLKWPREERAGERRPSGGGWQWAADQHPAAPRPVLTYATHTIRRRHDRRCSSFVPWFVPLWLYGTAPVQPISLALQLHSCTA